MSFLSFTPLTDSVAYRRFRNVLKTFSLPWKSAKLVRRKYHRPIRRSEFECLESRRVWAVQVTSFENIQASEQSIAVDWIYQHSRKIDGNWVHHYKNNGSNLDIRSKTQFHNFILPFDVDSSGFVDPNDVVVVINRLNRLTSQGDENHNPINDSRDLARLYFYDVNGNGVADPIDVLQIINRLNRPAPIRSKFEGIYVIGNSLSVDMLYNYKGAFEYTIQCNQNLQTIFDNPTGTCHGDNNTNAIRWDVAFFERSYDFVTVQPFYFTTLDQNFEIISTWMKLQPNAKFILHTGWPNVSLSDVYGQPLNPAEEFVHSKAHIDSLLIRIREAFPGRSIGSTNIIGSIDSIRQDILAGTSLITSLNQFYRDPVHFDHYGQYLATNSLYVSMGRAMDDEGFQSIPTEIRAYLKSKIIANATS